MAQVEIKDLNENQKVSNEEMKKALGGLTLAKTAFSTTSTSTLPILSKPTYRLTNPVDLVSQLGEAAVAAVDSQDNSDRLDGQGHLTLPFFLEAIF